MSSAGIFTDQHPTRELFLHRAIANFWLAKFDGMTLLDGTVIATAERALSIPANTAVLLIPENVHISVGFSYGAKQENAATRGCCWERRASKDEVNHIFISPALDDTAQVLLTLGHEFIHAILDCQDGHRGRFAEIATRAGFDGKMTSSHASSDLAMELVVLADELGDYPHGQLMVGIPVLTPVTPGGELVVPTAWVTTAGPAQRTRHIKVQCPSVEHAPYIVRMSATTISMGTPRCGVCDERMVAPDAV